MHRNDLLSSEFRKLNDKTLQKCNRRVDTDPMCRDVIVHMHMERTVNILSELKAPCTWV